MEFSRVPGAGFRRTVHGEVPTRKRPTGWALEVALEAAGAAFNGELDDNCRRPRTVPRCGRREAPSVRGDSLGHIGRQADVSSVTDAEAPENVDERLVHSVDSASGVPGVTCTVRAQSWKPVGEHGKDCNARAAERRRFCPPSSGCGWQETLALLRRDNLVHRAEARRGGPSVPAGERRLVEAAGVEISGASCSQPIDGVRRLVLSASWKSDCPPSPSAPESSPIRSNRPRLWRHRGYGGGLASIPPPRNEGERMACVQLQPRHGGCDPAQVRHRFRS
jgi:hypothetical protein